VPHDVFIRVVTVIVPQWEPREGVIYAARKH
jgi:hypothetical protein